MSDDHGADKHFELAVGIARDALKALLLVNAGAAGALIALTSKADSSRDYTIAILFFGCGAIITVASYAIAYFSQLSYANHCLQVSQDKDEAKREISRHKTFQTAAIIFVLVALGFSIMGMATAFWTARFN